MKTFLIDVMYTLLEPRGNKSRYEILQQLIERHVYRTAPVERIRQVYDEKRKLWEHQLPANHSSKWAIIDREIVRELFPDFPLAVAARAGHCIAIDTLTDPTLYEVSDDTKTFLTVAKGADTRLIIASNHDLDKVIPILKYFGIEKYFGAIYASTEIGFEKPHPDFFRAILKKEQLSAHECWMIGNNPDNDMAGARAAGIAGILYDPQRKHEGFSGLKVNHLSEVWSLLSSVKIDTSHTP